MIRVLLADDHRLMRQGLRRLLEADPEIEVVGEADDGLEVQRLIAETQPDVVLMDVSMGVVNGIAATRQISREFPKVRIIILSMHAEEGHVFQAIQAGARGYLLKTDGVQQVLSAIRAVAAGGAVLAAGPAEKVLAEFRRMAEKLGVESGLGQLSEVELRLLQLVAAGYSNKEIGDQLAFAESTVKHRLSILFQKIKVEDRTQAAIYAIRHGLVPLASPFSPVTDHPGADTGATARSDRYAR